MLHLLSKRTIAIISTSKRTICTKINTYATVTSSASLSSRLLVRRPRVYPQFFQPSAFRQYATKSRKYAKSTPKSANSGKSNLVVQNIKENLPGVDNQPRLLDRLRAAGAISDLQAPPSLSHFQRLFAPFIFTSAICGGSYYFAQAWVPAPVESRLFPTLPQSFTTVAAIIAANCAIFLAWKVPLPVSWRLLNRYFISVAGLPYSFSMIGSVFSHQTIAHLGLNMIGINLMTLIVCDQIGRGNFLALYFSAGAIASFTSLAYHVLGARFHITSLGASGAISGVLGTYAYFNPECVHTSKFIPLKVSQLVSGFALVGLVGIIRGWKTVDHMAHLSGLLWGLAFAYWKDQEFKKKREHACENSG
ncbi:hypothetical protein DFP73DRAFT_506924 [Morchella snyderi]|nr:hypothetical protein DFP73DRAFT_506924 [Morchella snyderi]